MKTDMFAAARTPLFVSLVCVFLFAQRAAFASAQILIGSETAAKNQVIIPLGSSSLSLSVGGQNSGTFTVVNGNPYVVTASVSGSKLNLNGLREGRAAFKIQETTSGTTRFFGVRVQKPTNSQPLPQYLAIGTVSQDTEDDIKFWEAISSDSALNKRADYRYIYLNGGPTNGWSTWGGPNGTRARTFIRNSQKWGLLTYFVWYNVPEGGESYTTDLANIADATYMAAYWQSLMLAINICNEESPDEPVGFVLEPDFLGYVMQANYPDLTSLNKPAMVSTAYGKAGPLRKGVDPDFPDTIKGLVMAINYILRTFAKNIVFGWQINVWASPNPGSALGVMHATEVFGFEKGKQFIQSSAEGVAEFYNAAGVTSYGADYIFFDKYGLDAGASCKVENPSQCPWFWNNDLWTSYLNLFIKPIHDKLGVPVGLWQTPVGRIENTQAISPYTKTKFTPLTNVYQKYEDSASTFFLGDTFVTSGERFNYFTVNNYGDSGVVADSSTGSITWRSHMPDTAAAGVELILFGAGVGDSTQGSGSQSNCPSDGYYWIWKIQEYYKNPVPLVRTCPPGCAEHGTCNADGVCICNAGWQGRACSDKACPNSCSNRGACDTTTGTCQCYRGYTNVDCSVPICAINPKNNLVCSNRGNCALGKTSIGACTCDTGYLGSVCELTQCPSSNGQTCAGHGTCDESTGTCVCSDSYFGSDCSQSAASAPVSIEIVTTGSWTGGGQYEVNIQNKDPSRTVSQVSYVLNVAGGTISGAWGFNQDNNNKNLFTSPSAFFGFSIPPGKTWGASGMGGSVGLVVSGTGSGSITVTAALKDLQWAT